MKRILPLLLILCLCACKNRKLEKQLSNFIGTEIVIPENLQANFRGVDTLILKSAVPLKMIVWYDSVGCSSCQINKIYEWNDVVSYGRIVSEVFEPLFIFSPRQGDLHSVNIALRSSRFDHHVFIDKDNSFYKSNPGIPTDKRMHTFLIDENNRVILVGNPVNNERMWELYKGQIENKRTDIAQQTAE